MRIHSGESVFLSALFLCLLLTPGGCRQGPYPGDPLEAARKVRQGEALPLLLDGRLTSLQRARVAQVLVSRFGVRAVPWIERVLRARPGRSWPDRALAVRALRAAGKDRRALRLLLTCLEESKDPDSRIEAARALALHLPNGEARRALARAARRDPSPRVRRAAREALGK